MAMGKRRQRQEALLIMTDGLPKSAGHPLYQRLNTLLAEADCDRWIEKRYQRYYEQEEKRRESSIPPSVYFRMLLVGYFEGIDSRGVAWRCADSLSLRQFLGIPLDEATPDSKTLGNTRRRLPEDVFDEVFQCVLWIAAEKKLLSGKTVGVDSTLLEANAAMKSIVRLHTGEDWKEYVTRLMREEGAIELDWASLWDSRGTGVTVREDDLFGAAKGQAELGFENAAGETYICGNASYKGSKWQTSEQNSDLQNAWHRFSRLAQTTDYVSGWIARYLDFAACTPDAVASFVATNSICQGQCKNMRFVKTVQTVAR